jgi:hypothetical protein
MGEQYGVAGALPALNPTKRATALAECRTCGALVADMTTHDRWHAAVTDIWQWIERVSGSSCEVARDVMGEQ